MRSFPLRDARWFRFLFLVRDSLSVSLLIVNVLKVGSPRVAAQIPCRYFEADRSALSNIFNTNDVCSQICQASVHVSRTRSTLMSVLVKNHFVIACAKKIDPVVFLFNPRPVVYVYWRRRGSAGAVTFSSAICRSCSALLRQAPTRDVGRGI